jgi:hypothetical protein
MKQCSYCGKEYSDDALICDLDQQELNACAPVSAPATFNFDQVAGKKFRRPCWFALYISTGLLLFSIFGSLILDSLNINNKNLDGMFAFTFFLGAYGFEFSVLWCFLAAAIWFFRLCFAGKLCRRH